MSVIPLHDRVLIKPVVQPITSDLLVIPETHYEPEQMGEVVALGTGMESRKRAVTKVLDQVIHALDHARDDEHFIIESVRAMRDAYQPEHVCAVGDCVAFAPKDGQEIQVDGESFIILREDDLLAVIEPVNEVEGAAL